MGRGRGACLPGQPSVTARRGVEVDAVGVRVLGEPAQQVVPDAAGLEGARGLQELELEEDSASAI